jgi:hypothetical protein
MFLGIRFCGLDFTDFLGFGESDSGRGLGGGVVLTSKCSIIECHFKELRKAGNGGAVSSSASRFFEMIGRRGFRNSRANNGGGVYLRSGKKWATTDWGSLSSEALQPLRGIQIRAGRRWKEHNLC